MAPVILAIVAIVMVFGLLLYFTTRWSLSYVQRVMGERVKAVDQIVNEGRVPDAWLSWYKKKLRALKDKSNRDTLLPRYQSLTKKHCIANLDELIRFTEQAKYEDADDGKAHLLDALRSQRERWDNPAFWQTVFEQYGG